MKKLAILSLLAIALALGARAGDISEAYRQAETLEARSRGKVARVAIRPGWSADGSKAWYRNERPGGIREFIVVDPKAGIRRPAFDAKALAEALAGADGRTHDPDRLPIERFLIEDDGSVRFELAGKGYRFGPGPGPLAEAKAPLAREDRNDRTRDDPPVAPKSPDGRWSVSVGDHNVILRAEATRADSPLTIEGTEDDGYRADVTWSPDSKKVVAMRVAAGSKRSVHLIESSPRDQLQPRLKSHDYLKPGDRVPVARPHLFDVEARREIPIPDDLAPEPWSLDEVRWAPDSNLFTYQYNQRGHQLLRLIAVDAATGRSRTVVEDRSPTFVDYAQKHDSRHLDATGELIWMSERDGWNHLYLVDVASGTVKNPITRGEWVVRSVVRIDEARRQVWFEAGGIRRGQDPYQVHLARANFDGSGLVILTEGDGTHEVELAPGGDYLIDTYSQVDRTPVVELRRGDDGSLVRELERVDLTPLIATGWAIPERFAAKGRDGTTDIYGVIFRPSRFDPAAKLPIIEQVYAGPHGAFAPKRFEPFHRPQALAELGFVVVQADGMGTNWRSKAFHDVCWKDLADAGFPDRIAWIKAAATVHAELDATRVGIYGGSAGGQSALRALLSHGDFYRAAAADCGCHDNRMDKIWWNELWMGWPIGPHYAAQANATDAGQLRGKLLLTVGELDRNVDPASTMQVVDALIRAGKDFELIVFPGAGHGAGNSPYGERRMRDFFVRHLLGVEPPDRNAGP